MNLFCYKKSANQKIFQELIEECKCQSQKKIESKKRFIYFEIKIETLSVEKNEKYQKQYLIRIRDISEFAHKQQDQIDCMYKDAILSNYSHEQLTPLNSILNNAMLLIDYLNKIKSNLNQCTFLSNSNS